MNILFITAHPFIPQMKGGLQVSANTLVKHLTSRGHKVSLLCGLMGSGWLALRDRVLLKLLRQKAASDHFLGYPVWRAWFPWDAVAFTIAREKPDVVVVLARQPVRMALEAKKLGVPIVMMLQDVEFHDHGGSFADLGKIPCVANSRFTANRYNEAFGVEPSIIHPMIDGAAYITSSNRQNVTYINPHPKKGLDLAVAIARQLPDIPFLFVEAWPLSEKERQNLETLLQTAPNVTLHKSVSDMQQIYGKSAIILMPSKWEEAFGRVAVEAQFSGIPVVASNRGGLPEAVGKGGVLLDPDGPVEPWVAAIRRLWDDKEYYATLSAAALTHSEDPIFNLGTQLAAWEKAIGDAAPTGIWAQR